jgi:multisubunit Na+/H+ antiporter MnhG subunit
MFDGAGKVVRRAVIVVIIIALITPVGAHDIVFAFFHDMSVLLFGPGGHTPSIKINH